jgi:hypothetical protein
VAGGVGVEGRLLSRGISSAFLLLLDRLGIAGGCDMMENSSGFVKRAKICLGC